MNSFWFRSRSTTFGLNATPRRAASKVAAGIPAAKARAEWQEKNKPVPFTDEELAAARVVRTMYGWWRVLRVNGKTVTVAGDFGDMRVPHAQVLEVRS